MSVLGWEMLIATCIKLILTWRFHKIWNCIINKIDVYSQELKCLHVEVVELYHCGRNDAKL